MHMLKRKTIISLVCLLFSTISLAQTVPEKYVVIVFENTRYYWEEGKHLHFKENYYWISPVDSLIERGVAYPLYIPSGEDCIFEKRDTSIFSNIAMCNLNGLLCRKTFHVEESSPSYETMKTIDNNKRRILVEDIRYSSRLGIFQKRKEKTVISYVPVIGRIQKGRLRTDEGEELISYYITSLERVGEGILNEREELCVLHTDYSMMDYSCFAEHNQRIQKGFRRMKLGK